MRPFTDLVAEAVAADVDGWGFDWLDGRATEERPPWGYARLLSKRLATLAQTDPDAAALDIDTGGGEVVNEAPTLPRKMTVTESWAPNAARARALLGARGVTVIDTSGTPGTGGQRLPFPDNSFDLVSSRHPVSPDWPEIHRVLKPGGRYVAQHVGPASGFELIEHFLGPRPVERTARDPHGPDGEVAAAEAAGLTVERLETARCRIEFSDVGTVVWLLRKCVWWVPDFTVDRYADALHDLDARMRAGHPFVSYSSRHLIEATAVKDQTTG